MEGLPLDGLVERLYRVLLVEEVKKSVYTYVSLVEGRVQVEYETPQEGEDYEVLLPVELNNFEDLKEEYLIIKRKLRLRRLRLALMAWLSNAPVMASSEILGKQRELLLERSTMSLMGIKEELKFETAKFLFDRHRRVKCEVNSEINLLKCILLQELAQKGIDCIEQEQKTLAELTTKSLNSVEFSIDAFKGPFAAIGKSLSDSERKAVTEGLSFVRAFVAQIKNRATMIESEKAGMQLLINLHDFNDSVYNWCKNVWRLQCTQKYFLSRTKANAQQELQVKLYSVQDRIAGLKMEIDQVKHINACSAAIEVMHTCSDHIHLGERQRNQDKYWAERIDAVRRLVRKKAMVEVEKELEHKDAQLKARKEEFNSYKEKVTAQLKLEVKKEEVENSHQLMLKAINAPKEKQQEIKDSASRRKEVDKSLREVQETIQRLRLLFNLSLLSQRKKCRDRISLLRDTIFNNTSLHQKLSLAERREFIFKQELLRGHEAIHALEKVMKINQTALKGKNESIMRIYQARKIKSQKLAELEAKLKKCSGADKMDILMIQKKLEEMHKETEELKSITADNSKAKNTQKIVFNSRLKFLKNKLSSEKLAKTDAITHINSLLSQRKETAESLWESKYQSLLSFFEALKHENKLLRAALGNRAHTHKRSNTQQIVMSSRRTFKSNICTMGMPKRSYKAATELASANKSPLKTEEATRRNSSVHNEYFDKCADFSMAVKGRSYRNSKRFLLTSAKRSHQL